MIRVKSGKCTICLLSKLKPDVFPKYHRHIFWLLWCFELRKRWHDPIQVLRLFHLKVVWSPDSRLIAAGGEDDFVTLFSTGRDARIIARCQGHSSYVTCIAFDPQSNNPSSRAYRFISVGEDGKLLFVSPYQLLLSLCPV